jgi:hypothetical protein
MVVHVAPLAPLLIFIKYANRLCWESKSEGLDPKHGKGGKCEGAKGHVKEGNGREGLTKMVSQAHEYGDKCVLTSP